MKTAACVFSVLIVGVAYSQVADQDQASKLLPSHWSPVWSESQSSDAAPGLDFVTLLDKQKSQTPFWLALTRRKLDENLYFRAIKRPGEPGRGWFTNWESSLSIAHDSITQFIGGETHNKFEKKGGRYATVGTLELKQFGTRDAPRYTVTDSTDNTVFNYECMSSFNGLKITCLTSVVYGDGRKIELKYVIPPLIQQVTDARDHLTLSYTYNGFGIESPEQNYLDSIQLIKGGAMAQQWQFKRTEEGNLKQILSSN